MGITQHGVLNATRVTIALSKAAANNQLFNLLKVKIKKNAKCNFPALQNVSLHPKPNTFHSKKV